MAIQRRSATLTLPAAGAADAGFDEADVSIYPNPTSGVRLTRLYGVRARTSVASKLNVEVRAVDVEPITTNGATAEESEYGDVLCFVGNARPGKVYFPRRATADEHGDAASVGEGFVPIETAAVRVAVTATPAVAGTVIVDVFYETAGDQRF